jgi:RNA-binding protein
MSAPTLSGRQKRHLRALAHQIDPLVQVGKEGVSEALVAATDRALTDHELVKVRLPQVERAERAEMASALERATGAALTRVVATRRNGDHEQQGREEGGEARRAHMRSVLNVAQLRMILQMKGSGCGLTSATWLNPTPRC